MTRAEHAAEQLRLVVGAIVRRVRAESTGQGLSWPQMSVLRRLEDGGEMTTADLARANHVTPQSMGSLVAELEAAGMVARSDDRTDGRRRLVSMTRAGSRVLADGRAARQSWLARAIDKELDGDEQRSLLTALELLQRIAAA